VRYTGVELGEGGLLPRKPSETLKRRFGDCKDKAVLLTAMLRASDIPAYVALLNAAEDEADVEESLPGFGLFNHAIVVVPGSPAIWIDPTDPYARAGELPVADQGRLALIASPTATALTRTPEATSADNREVETREFFLSDLGPSRVVETTELYGAPESYLRAYYAVEDAQAVRQALESYAGTQYLAEDLAALEYSKPTDLTTPMRLRIEVKNARRGFTDVHKAGVGVSPATLLTRLPPEITEGPEEETEEKEGGAEKTARKRQDDYVFSRPMTIETRYRIVPPTGFAPQPLPASRVRRFGTVTLSEEYAVGEDRAVTAVFRLDTGKRRISVQELEALRSSVHEALQEETFLLLFDQTGEVHLANGRMREAFAEFQALAAAAPKQALPRARIARALLAGGMGEAAREEARRATRLEPKLAIAWRDLGWILQHDELGRRFGAGFDRAGAIAAYRKARELDPKDAIARADLAILLEYDDQGQRYSSKADLTAAIDEYRALRKDLDNKAMDNNLLFALVRAGRFAEAKELAGKDTGTAIALAAIAAADGAEAAVREAERKLADKNARAEALQQASQNLIALRRYAEAAALLDRASRQSGNAAALLSRADLLRRTRRHEEVPLPLDQPATLGKRLMLVAAGEKPDLKKLSSLFSRDFEPEILAMGDKAAALFDAGISPLRKKLRSQEISMDVVIDFVLSALQESVSGDEALGYRVAYSSSFDGSSQDLVVYAVREGAEYRIAGLGNAVSMLGAEALRRAERGDLKGARQWLDWAAEHEDGGTSDDPIPERPFTVLWKKGAEAGAEEIRCAAAALIKEEEGGKMLRVLKACLELAAGSDGDDARRNALDVVISVIHQHAGRYAEMEAVTRRLVTAAPDSRRAEALHVAVLVNLGRWDEVRALAERRLQRSPGDLAALRLLAEDALRAGDFERAEKHLLEITGNAKAGAQDFNQLAWMLLELGRVDEKTVGYGQRAATLSSYGNPGSLHTLAAIYADLGKTAEAYQVILQSLAAKVDEAPDAHDWYVFGRLAEHYGLPDVARGYYKKVAPAKLPEDEPMSTHALAARRLAVLGEGKRQEKAKL
jgi:tetratricopeptide (TPR) repeat protein